MEEKEEVKGGEVQRKAERWSAVAREIIRELEGCAQKAKLTYLTYLNG